MHMSFSSGLQKRLIGISAFFVVGSIMFSAVAFASNIEYSDSVDVDFGNLTLTIKDGSTASSVTINASTMNVVTGSGDSFTIISPSHYQITTSPTQTTTCNSNLSQVVIDANQSVTITPTTTPCVTSGAVRESYSNDPVATDIPVVPEVAVVKTFTSADYFSDLSGLSEKQKQDVINLTQYLIDHKTLFPIEKTKKYYPNYILTYGYAIQIANSFSPLGCGSNEYLGIHSCSDHAIKMSYVESGHAVNSRITRLDFYKVLLEAINKKIIVKKNALTQFTKYCSDSTGVSVDDANAYLTARQYNIVTRFKSGKCQLSLYMPRVEAAAVGVRMMSR